MNDQPPIDGYHHADPRRTRSAMQSIVPVATGLAKGVVRLLPQLAHGLIWFDNEWGFANRMLELAAFWGGRLTR